jgi:Tfp pilus assembly pilus retraction ATPase PilT
LKTTLARQITEEVVSGTMHTGLTGPFERTVEYVIDEFRNNSRQMVRFMASTQEVAAA